MRTPTISLLALSLTAGLGLSGLTGCSTGGNARGVTLDGDTAEWAGGMTTQADAETLSFVFSPGEPATLQANEETTRLLFDLDNDPETGERLAGPTSVGTLGVDLEILLSPLVDDLEPSAAKRLRDRRAERGQTDSPFASGVHVIRHDGVGQTHLGHAAVGFFATPTYASEFFEARIDRTAPALQGTGIDAAGEATGLVLMTDGDGRVARYSDPIRFVMPAAAQTRALANKGIPDQPAGTIRVLSMNVLRGKPQTDPAPFARLIAAVEPDVILFQEADDFEAQALEAWLSGFVGPLPTKHAWADGVQGVSGGGVGAWDAVSIPELGVAVATPHVVTASYTDPIRVVDPRDGDLREVRAITALVSTPTGEILACSTHLKCCGSAGSSEDLIRISEAQAINEAFAKAAENVRGSLGREIAASIIGGDMNLVGTRSPLDLLMGGLNSDGTDLTPATTGVIGDSAIYTWREDRSFFGPGRLDWFLTGEADIAQAFALDTRLINPDRLAQWGLYPDDSAVSDHLPVVVDLKP